MAEALSDDYGSKDESIEDSHDEEKKRILNDEEIKTYFRVDLMYNKRKDEWSKCTYLQYKLALNSKTGHSNQFILGKMSFIKSDRLFSSSGQHAEIFLMTHLRELLNVFKQSQLSQFYEDLDDISFLYDQDRSKEDQKMMKMTLKILMNYSPCKDCADEIIAFMKEIENDIEIQEIKIKFGTFYKCYLQREENKNHEGLANLKNAGIQLRLVWDSKSLKKTIETIGNEEERRAREQRDRELMQQVTIKAESLRIE